MSGGKKKRKKKKSIDDPYADILSEMHDRAQCSAEVEKGVKIQPVTHVPVSPVLRDRDA